MSEDFPDEIDQGQIAKDPALAVPGFEHSAAMVARELMAEKLPPLLPPPANVASRGRWAAPIYRTPEHLLRPETVELTRGERFVIDPMKEAMTPESLSFPTQSGTQEHLFIAGSIGLLGDNRDPEITLAVARIYNRQADVNRWFLIGPQFTDERGQTTRTWIELYEGNPRIIGRDGSEGLVYGGVYLMGKAFSDRISRKHVSVELTKEGIVVEDTSTNHTLVTGNRAPVAHEPTSASSSQAGLIDEVPKNDGDVQRLRHQEEMMRQQPIHDEFEALGKEIDELTAGLSENDSLNLWKYASGTINSREARQRGEGQEVKNQNMIASEGLSTMSARAKAIANKYLDLMQRRTNLLRRQ